MSESALDGGERPGGVARLYDDTAAAALDTPNFGSAYWSIGSAM